MDPNANIGYQTDVGPIESVLVSHARDAFVSDEAIGVQWQKLNYIGRPDLDKASGESDAFIDLLSGVGIDVHLLRGGERTGLDSIYTRDASVMCGRGAILCNMGKPARASEPDAQGEAFTDIGIPIHGRIDGDGRLEGGDVVWLGERLVAVGRGYRTNDEGIRQLRDLLGGLVDDVITVPLPHWRGPEDVFHLMSILSPIDRDLALVYSPLMPVVFREVLVALGMALVEVPDAEFESMGCNVLAVAPRKCVMLSGNPKTRRRLEGAGADVYEYAGEEISRKGAGGPTCLTRPLRRRLT
jgi:N-dimethylarginine dimethylaminohydrolase